MSHHDCPTSHQDVDTVCQSDWNERKDRRHYPHWNSSTCKYTTRRSPHSNHATSRERSLRHGPNPNRPHNPKWRQMGCKRQRKPRRSIRYLLLSYASDRGNVEELARIVLNTTEEYQSDRRTLFFDRFKDIFSANVSLVLVNQEQRVVTCKSIFILPLVVWVRWTLGLDRSHGIEAGIEWHSHH